MNIIITGGAGFLGSLLAKQLLEQYPELNKITLVDRIKVDTQAQYKDLRIQSICADLTDQSAVSQIISKETTHVFHLAAIVSSDAEENFDLGMQVNLQATMLLLEACRQVNPNIRFVFSSSLAVFGGVLPDPVTAMTACQPSSSYGTQKAVGELLVNDYGRKNLLDAITVRLPTICIRPGAPNKAASSFVSGIIREPLKGERSNCPVDLNLSLWISSPETVIKNIIFASALNKNQITGFRTFNLPGIEVTPQQMLDTLSENTGKEKRELVSTNFDENINNIVASWPKRINVDKEIKLGFQQDKDFLSIYRKFIN